MSGRILFVAALSAILAGCGSSSSSPDGGGAGDTGGGGAQALCTSTGGKVETASCCKATSDFPDSCAVGACGCSPDNSKPVMVCACPMGQCFNPTKGCTAGM